MPRGKKAQAASEYGYHDEPYGPRYAVKEDPLRSKIHSASAAAISSDLDIFLVPNTNYSIERSKPYEYLPIAGLNPQDRTYEFKVLGDPDFIDLSSIYLHVKYTVTRSDNQDFTDAGGTLNNVTYQPDNIRTTIIPLHALWSQIDLYLNNVRITDQYSSYPYQAYFNELLYSTPESRRTHRKVSGLGDTSTEAFEKKLENKKVYNIADKLHLPMLDSDKALLSHVTLFFRFTRSRSNFAIHNHSSPPWSKDFNIKIQNLVLKLKKYRLNPQVSMAIESALLTSTAKYSFTRTAVVPYAIAANQHNIQIDNILTGIIPHKIVLAVLENDRFVGTGMASPFKFNPLNVRTIYVTVNGQRYPDQGSYETDWSDTTTDIPHLESYLKMFQELAQDTSNPTINITLDEYKNSGKTIYAYNFAPIYLSAGVTSGCTVPLQKGNLRVDITFSTAPTSALTLLVYAEWDGLIQIDAKREIVTNW